MDDKERQRIDDYLDTNMYQYFEKYLKMLSVVNILLVNK